jgi:4-hydroxy-3-methylbut-2-en-1-yl diphosphate synthase IspG/GcpE
MANIHSVSAIVLRVAECFDKISVNPGKFLVSDVMMSLICVGYM